MNAPQRFGYSLLKWGWNSGFSVHEVFPKLLWEQRQKSLPAHLANSSPTISFHPQCTPLFFVVQPLLLVLCSLSRCQPVERLAYSLVTLETP